jgi:hypothetical protein
MRPRHCASSVPRGRWSQRDCVPVSRAWASGGSDRPKPRDSAEVCCSDSGPKSVTPTGRDSEALPPGLLSGGRRSCECRRPLGCPWPGSRPELRRHLGLGTDPPPQGGSGQVTGRYVTRPKFRVPSRYGRRRESDRAGVLARGRGRSASHPHVVHNHFTILLGQSLRVQRTSKQDRTTSSHKVKERPLFYLVT